METNSRILEMADRYDRIYNNHWEKFCRIAHDYNKKNQYEFTLDEFDMPHDIKEVVLVWGGANAGQYLKEKAPNMGGLTLEDLAKTPVGIKALKSMLLEINC